MGLSGATSCAARGPPSHRKVPRKRPSFSNLVDVTWITTNGDLMGRTTRETVKFARGGPRLCKARDLSSGIYSRSRRSETVSYEARRARQSRRLGRKIQLARDAREGSRQKTDSVSALWEIDEDDRSAAYRQWLLPKLDSGATVVEVPEEWRDYFSDYAFQRPTSSPLLSILV